MAESVTAHPNPKTPVPFDPSLEVLKQDILESNIQPVVSVWRGDTVEVSRLFACIQLGIVPQFDFLEDPNPPQPMPTLVNLALSMNSGQRAICAAQMSMSMRHGGNRNDPSTRHIPTIEQSAERFGVSPRSVKRARTVLLSRDAELIRRCLLPTASPDHISVAKAAKLAKQSIEDQATLRQSLEYAFEIIPHLDPDSSMTVAQRAIAAIRFISNIRSQRQDHNTSNSALYTMAQIAEAFRVSHETIHEAQTLLESGDGELIRRCLIPAFTHGQLTIPQALSMQDSGRIPDHVPDQDLSQPSAGQPRDNSNSADVAKVQRAFAAARLTMPSQFNTPLSPADAARTIGVGVRSVRHARQVLICGDHKLLENCQLPRSSSNRVSLPVAADKARELITIQQEQRQQEIQSVLDRLVQTNAPTSST